MEQIQTLWQQHSAAAFPEACRGAEVEGTDLVMLDADTAGCIQTFLERGGHLDLGRVAVLGLCYGELAVALRVLEGEAHAYFSRLQSLARLVLQAAAHEHNET